MMMDMVMATIEKRDRGEKLGRMERGFMAVSNNQATASLLCPSSPMGLATITATAAGN